MKRITHTFLLIILSLIGTTTTCTGQIVNHSEGDSYKKILKLIQWLKTNYPEEDRKKWDETCNLLVEWSITDPTIDVVINVDIIEDLINEEEFNYRVESVRIFTLGVIADNLSYKRNRKLINSTYQGLLDMINFYKIVTLNDQTVESQVVERFIKLEEENALKNYVCEFLKNKN